MKLSDFDYNLPVELIAQTPAPVRDQSRLMVVDRNSSSIRMDIFRNISNYLTSRHVLVFNNTKVIPAKLLANRLGGEKPVEILLVREIKPGTWEALIKGLARLKLGTRLTFEEDSLSATLEEKSNGRGILKFDYPGDLKGILNRISRTPLPPYIRRKSKSGLDAVDRNQYQTIFAEKPGAIAAPTAGLHFTKKLLASLKQNGLETLFLTLHVGPGTFQPLRRTTLEQHRIDSENYCIPKKIWNRLVEIKKERKPIVAVGTTSTRTLESVQFTLKVKNDISGWTQLFIRPGYHFNNIDHLLTNFHLPKSTLFILVCAFGGVELMKRAYETAITEKFRFYSYGDAMLIL